MRLRGGVPFRPNRLSARTPPSQGGKPGATPGWGAQSGTWCKSSIAVFQAVDSGASPDVPATPPWCEQNEHVRLLTGSVKVQLLPAAPRQARCKHFDKLGAGTSQAHWTRAAAYPVLTRGCEGSSPSVRTSNHGSVAEEQTQLAQDEPPLRGHEGATPSGTTKYGSVAELEDAPVSETGGFIPWGCNSLRIHFSLRLALVRPHRGWLSASSRFVQEQDPWLTSRRWGCDSLSGNLS